MWIFSTQPKFCSSLDCLIDGDNQLIKAGASFSQNMTYICKFAIMRKNDAIVAKIANMRLIYVLFSKTAVLIFASVAVYAEKSFSIHYAVEIGIFNGRINTQQYLKRL